MSVRQYIGARYVPRFLGTYIGTQDYEPLDVVDNGMGTSYISKIPTPAGTPLTDTDHWAIYGTTNAAIINLQNQIDVINANLAIINGSILCIGNSYVQRDVTGKLQTLFAHSYRKTSGGTGFADRTGNPTTYLDLLVAAINDPDIPNDEITDIIFVSAMGDTWGITEQGYATYENAVETNMNLMSTTIGANFANIRRVVVTLAECRNAVYFSDDRYDALFMAHKIFKKLCPLYDMDYIGWTGWNNMFSGAANYEIDNYHPTASGAAIIGQDIVDAYFGNLEYKTFSSSASCDFNITSAGTIGVQIYIRPDEETIICRVANITAGPQVIGIGDEVIDLKQIPIPPIAPLEQSNVYLQGNFNTLGGTVDLTRVTCTLQNNANGIATLTLSNVTDGNNIGSSQGIIPEFTNLHFIF